MLISVRKHCLPDVILRHPKEKDGYFYAFCNSSNSWTIFFFSGKARHPKYLPEEGEEILFIQQKKKKGKKKKGGKKKH